MASRAFFVIPPENNCRRPFCDEKPGLQNLSRHRFCQCLPQIVHLRPKIAAQNRCDRHLHERVLKVLELTFNSLAKVPNMSPNEVCGSRRCNVPGRRVAAANKFADPDVVAHRPAAFANGREGSHSLGRGRWAASGIAVVHEALRHLLFGGVGLAFGARFDEGHKVILKFTRGYSLQGDIPPVWTRKQERVQKWKSRVGEWRYRLEGRQSHSTLPRSFALPVPLGVMPETPARAEERFLASAQRSVSP